MTVVKIIIATRKSPLALWQANYVGAALKKQWPQLQFELVPMLTSGDRFLQDKLLTKGGKGLFVKELEQALLSGQADIAVHSMKDVPALLPDGLTIAAICQRDNPFDVLISRNSSSLDSLATGSVIGTSSLRRQAQLLAYRSDLQIKTLRGNINTRLDKLQNGEYDAIVLAVAGLTRLGIDVKYATPLTEQIMLPACGQGALGVECRANDSKILKWLEPLNDSISAHCIHAERALNAKLGGNCHAPLAVYCKALPMHRLLLQAKVMSVDGKIILTDARELAVDQYLTLANLAAAALLAQGAQQILQASYDNL